MSDLTFHITQGRTWLGNGFGTEPAHWEARLNGKVVGTWRPSGGGTFRSVDAVIFGVCESFIRKHAEWKTRVRQELDRRVREGYPLRDDVTEFWENRQAGPGGVQREEYHGIRLPDGREVSHLVAAYVLTGDLDEDLDVFTSHVQKHRLTCSYYTKYRKW